jgi:DNA-binding NarL/FixJ family response regulator
LSAQPNLLIVEPSDIIREGLFSLLDGDFNLLAPLRNATDLALRLPVLQPDVLLINPTLLPVPANMELAALRQARPSMAVVGLVYQYVDPAVLQSFTALLDIREPQNRVAQILRDSLAARENAVGSPSGSRASVDEESADRLFISIHTVNTHRKNITRKTGIKSVAGLTVYATLHNLL